MTSYVCRANFASAAPTTAGAKAFGTSFRRHIRSHVPMARLVCLVTFQPLPEHRSARYADDRPVASATGVVGPGAVRRELIADSKGRAKKK